MKRRMMFVGFALLMSVGALNATPALADTPWATPASFHCPQ
ncbi:hypothetical protein [Nonomuraea gerenzanensis]|uniref:Uncharacterized protein n=1 Tax=Nonomuraea gerenzanensis TaxID=93944 RepID=A0A1M4EDL0_9ACTN|nr:hypothetical protein [Nonomuraea gerenzanensis]SBO96806.1 hypothetical protein BN4615_P6322 [Nonomuraea gerenzanensis]